MIIKELNIEKRRSVRTKRGNTIALRIRYIFHILDDISGREYIMTQ